MQSPIVSTYIKPSSKLKKDWFYWWIQNHWIVSSGEFSGGPYRFHPNYIFLEEYAKDPSNRIVIMEAAQMGLSEINIAKFFAYADLLKGNLMYVLPTDDSAYMKLCII